MKENQSGAALAVSLIILLIMTLIVVSSAQQVALQEKMTASVRNGYISLEMAETGLKDAESKIDSFVGTGDFNPTGNNGLYSLDNGPSDLFDPAIWVDAKTIAGSSTMLGADVRYFIENTGVLLNPEDDLGGINVMGYGQTTGGGDVTMFKVVSRSMGTSGTAERIVVSMFGKRL